MGFIDFVYYWATLNLFNFIVSLFFIGVFFLFVIMAINLLRKKEKDVSSKNIRNIMVYFLFICSVIFPGFFFYLLNDQHEKYLKVISADYIEVSNIDTFEFNFKTYIKK